MAMFLGCCHKLLKFEVPRQNGAIHWEHWRQDHCGNQTTCIHTDGRIIVGQCREAIRYSDHGKKTLEGRGHAPKESPWINVSPPGCVQVSIQANKIILKVLIVEVDRGLVPCRFGSWIGQSTLYNILIYQMSNVNPIWRQATGLEESKCMFISSSNLCVLNADTHCKLHGVFYVHIQSCK